MKAKCTTRSEPATAGVDHVRISALVAHPDQERYFGDYDAKVFADLVASIKTKGVVTPIMVLPAGNAAELPANTIIGGHTRARAAEAAGLTTIPVHIRRDLVAASRPEIDEIFLTDNTLRRQLSPLAEARAAVGIYRARKARAGRSLNGRVAEDAALRDQIGKIIGMSGRNLARYLSVLDAPLEVQREFEAGRISLVAAARVTTLPPSRQRELATRLRANEDPRAVLDAYFPRGDGRHRKLADAVAAFARALAAAGHDLEARLDEVRPWLATKYAAPLRAGAALIDELLAKTTGQAKSAGGIAASGPGGGRNR